MTIIVCLVIAGLMMYGCMSVNVVSFGVIAVILLISGIIALISHNSPS